MTSLSSTRARSFEPESAHAWYRLGITAIIGIVGGVGMWSVPVALPAVQADFGVDRAAASLPYTVTMIGFALGGVALGRLGDRFGILFPLIGGTLLMSLGYIAAGLAPNLWWYALAQGLLVGGGTSAYFGPLMAEVSHWFVRRRGIAVSICAAGNYMAGALWPTPFQHFIDTIGWRSTHIAVGVICFVVITPLALLLRRRVAQGAMTTTVSDTLARRSIDLSPRALQTVLGIAGVCCCVAMGMPQVHIVAYCGDLGYGAARGAEMLSLMLGFGIISRVGSGIIADRIGGVAVLLLGAVLQGSTLLLFFMFNGLTSLYVISALFGLFQGGIVPSYVIIVREYFPPKEAGTRAGLALMATLVGMALGAWMSGAIFDLTGSYRAAFANGLAFNLVNVSIVAWLLLRSRGPQGTLAPA
jgi:MFS family permease